MKKFFIVYGHYDDNSFNAAIKDTFIASAVKAGHKIDLVDLFNYCKDLNLEVVGLMCIPPVSKDSNQYFKEMNLLNQNLRLKELSMGMSADFLKASIHSATFLRIGSAIFGNRD